MFAVHDSKGSCIRFGVFELEPDTGELLKAGTPIKLPPQAIGVLMLLANAGGEIVRRQEIQKEIWGETFVDFDHGLNRCIKQIRAALCDSAENPRYVETLRGRGYRFLMSIEKTPGPSWAREKQCWAKRLIYRVAGFKNLSQRPEQAWISAALSEMLITELAVEGNVSALPFGDGQEAKQAPVNLPASSLADSRPEMHRVALAECDRIVDGSYMVVTRSIDEYIRLDIRVQDAAQGTMLLAFSETDALSNLPELVSRAGERLRMGLNPVQLRREELAS